MPSLIGGVDLASRGDQAAYVSLAKSNETTGWTNADARKLAVVGEPPYSRARNAKRIGYLIYRQQI